MVGLEKANTYHGMDFIRIAYDALFNDMIAHVIKVLEDRSDVASFWYIKRCKEREVSYFVQNNGINLSKLEVIKDALKHIRDKTHFHIDRDAVKNLSEIWKEAALTRKQLVSAIEDVYSILDYLYQLEFGEHFPLPEYDGSDATSIAKFAENITKNNT
ncbi:MAG: hypothetical protein DRN81_04790 [Thermoproteota archaeon]|nr:MAG: hypothetical protein DRN81_04790 [Candidatus Korarchaeota archaeon]